jgi:hypothetical protein
MGVRYTNEAVQRCYELYLQFNGGQHERIETEMRKEYPGWSKSNLYDKGKPDSKKFRPGWPKLYNWKDALALKVATSGESAATSAELLFLEIEIVRRRLAKEMATKGAQADKDLVYQHRDYCKLSIDALARLEAARDNLAGFAKLWQDLLKWLPSISEKANRELLKVSDQIIERARLEYASSDSKE